MVSSQNLSLPTLLKKPNYNKPTIASIDGDYKEVFIVVINT
jgi:hypothetical protein